MLCFNISAIHDKIHTINTAMKGELHGSELYQPFMLYIRIFNKCIQHHSVDFFKSRKTLFIYKKNNSTVHIDFY